MNGIVALIIGLFIVIGIISLLVNVYNKLISVKFNTEKAYVNIDVLLKQRADEIPNLIEVTKEYIKYEAQTLVKLTETRTQFLKAISSEEKIIQSNELSKIVKGIFVAVENYPELKANQSFVVLQERVSKLEDHIADRREFFNDSINLYNIACYEFPSIIFAKMLGYQPKSLLIIDPTEKEYHGIKF